MKTYVMHARFTQQGIQNIKESPDRVEAFRQALEAAGAELVGIYLLMGPYDALAIIKAPDDETITQITLALGSKGNVRTETVRAFTEQEFRQLVAALP